MWVYRWWGSNTQADQKEFERKSQELGNKWQCYRNRARGKGQNIQCNHKQLYQAQYQHSEQSARVKANQKSQKRKEKNQSCIQYLEQRQCPKQRKDKSNNVWKIGNTVQQQYFIQGTY